MRRWTELWRQLRDLRQGAFSQLPPEDLLADFCAALLRCAKWRLAQKYLAGTASVALDPGRAEDLVLACAKEYFFSANSLHSPEVAQVDSHRAQLILFAVAFLSWGMLTPVTWYARCHLKHAFMGVWRSHADQEGLQGD